MYIARTRAASTAGRASERYVPALVAPIKRRSATPASAPRDDAFGFDHEVRPVINELGIEPHDRAARLDLRIVESCAGVRRCRVHYFDERRNVVLNGKSAREVHCASVAHLSSNDHVEPEGSSQGETALVQAAAEFKPTAQQFSPSRDTLSSTFPADRPLPRRAHGRSTSTYRRPVLGALRTLRHLGCPRDHPAGGTRSSAGRSPQAPTSTTTAQTPAPCYSGATRYYAKPDLGPVPTGLLSCYRSTLNHTHCGITIPGGRR